MSTEYGKKISPVLAEIADTMWEIDARQLNEPYSYTPEGFRGALKIMMSASMDRLWLNQEKAELPLETRLDQAQALGEDLRQLVAKHLGVDTTQLYERKQ